MVFKIKNFFSISKNKLSFFFINHVDIIKIYYFYFALILAGFGVIRPLILIYLLLVIDYLKKTHMKNFFLIFHQDQKTIKNHWENDSDLIIFFKITKFLYISGFSLFVFFVFMYFQYEEISINYFVDAVLLVLIGRTIDLICTLHIIFYRNNEVIGKIVQTGYKLGGYVFGGGLLAYFTTDFVYHLPSEPSKLSNAWHIHTYNGRGYGYKSMSQQAQDNVLLVSGIYPNKDQFELIFLEDDGSKIMSQEKVLDFIKKNQSILRARLSPAQCQIIGIKKGYVL